MTQSRTRPKDDLTLSSQHRFALEIARVRARDAYLSRRWLDRSLLRALEAAEAVIEENNPGEIDDETVAKVAERAGIAERTALRRLRFFATAGFLSLDLDSEADEDRSEDASRMFWREPESV